ncbi:cytochrome-c oxidase, cbb3-type subunit III [Yoonia sp. MH D7]
MTEHEKDIDQETGIETTGHEWDGIKELNNPLPRWWLWSLYLCIIWGVWYVIAYPAWPLIKGATEGYLGYSTRANVATDIAAVNDRNADLRAALTEVDLTVLEEDEALSRFAVAGGAAVFRTNCSQCHGSGAAGGKGYPNLLDDDWLWGGTIEDIAYTINHGIRNEVDFDSRWTEMPAFGDILESDQIDQVVQHVISLSSNEFDVAMAAEGAVVFDENCSSCHGVEGLGDNQLGAPNLADAIWLYGGDVATVTETVTNSRFGVMPPWGTRLSQSDVNAVAAYVHQLGGGE